MKLHYGRVLADRLDGEHGLPRARLEDLIQRFPAVLRRTDPRRVFVNVISKSGGTAETLSQYLVVRGWLDEALGQDAAIRHLAFTTDPVKGPLRALAEREGIAALEIPAAVGGRYSV